MTKFIQAIIYPNTKNTVHSSQSVRSPAVLDLPTSRAQSVFFGSAKNPKKPTGPPPEPEMRSEGLLRLQRCKHKEYKYARS